MLVGQWDVKLQLLYFHCVEIVCLRMDQTKAKRERQKETSSSMSRCLVILFPWIQELEGVFRSPPNLSPWDTMKYMSLISSHASMQLPTLHLPFLLWKNMNKAQRNALSGPWEPSSHPPIWIITPVPRRTKTLFVWRLCKVTVTVLKVLASWKAPSSCNFSCLSKGNLSFYLLLTFFFSVVIPPIYS